MKKNNNRTSIEKDYFVEIPVDGEAVRYKKNYAQMSLLKLGWDADTLINGNDIANESLNVLNSAIQEYRELLLSLENRAA